MRKLPSVILASAISVMTINGVQAEEQSNDINAQAPIKHRMHQPMGPMAKMFKGITLTDEQKKKIETLLQDERKNLPRPAQDDRQAIHDLIISETPQQSKIDAIAEQRASHEKQMVQSRITTQNKIYHILNVEQQKQYNENYLHFASERKMPHAPRK